MKEEWRWIKGYEGSYEVSNLGRVRSWFKWGTSERAEEPRLMKLYEKKRGYKEINLLGKFFLVHRLVAEAFIPNPDNKPEVDHIDTNPSNNRADNLRWSTRKEQMWNPITRKKTEKHSEEHRLKQSISSKNSNKVKENIRKLNDSKRVKVLCLDTGRIFGSIKEAEEEQDDNVRYSMKRGIKSNRGLYYARI